MLFHFLLAVLVIDLVKANTCPGPDGKLSCPTGKRCCFEAGQYACCDPLEDEEDLLPGHPSANYGNVSSDGVMNAYTADYCPNKFGKKLCCSSSTDCVAYSECCNAHGCCFRGLRCCGNGQWCCYKSQRCGIYYRTCRNSGMSLVPAFGTVALIAFVTIKSKFFF